MKRKTTLLAVALVLTGGMADAQVRVGSKIDTEGAVLGAIILQALEAGGIPVSDRTSLGGTPVVRGAITAGEIDIYPEYTGNGAFFFNEPENEIWNDLEAGFERVAELDRDENDIVWLRPAPANNTWAIALRAEIAEEHGLETMSDFGEWVAGGGEVILAASAEFVNSPNVLPAFQTTYGFEMSQNQLVILSGGDTAATIAAAARQTSGVNAAMVYGTDGGISPSGLVVMEDDAGVQPVYAPSAIVRATVLEEHPEIEEILEPIFEALSLEVLQELNGRVQVAGEPASAVAQDFLTREGFLN